MKFLRKALILSAGILFAIGCKDNNEDGNSISAREILVSKTWKRALVDKTPSILPSGRSSYQAPQQCDLDDSFKFSAGDILNISRGNNHCQENESSAETVSYTYNEEAGELVMAGVRYKVLEISENQLKFYLVSASVSGYDNIVILYQ